MGKLVKYLFVIFAFVAFSFGRSEVSEQFVNYSQIAMDLNDSFLSENREIPSDPRDWPMVQRHISKELSSTANFMRVMNHLVLVPNSPTISCFGKVGRASQHDGSRIIALSRNMVRRESGDGRYVILQTQDPPSVWATWLREEDAAVLFQSLGGFDPAQEPILFPEITATAKAERDAERAEYEAGLEHIREREARQRVLATDSRVPEKNDNNAHNKDWRWLLLIAVLVILSGVVWSFGRFHRST